METSNASQFAGFALQVICRQEWVRERCLQDPQVLCSPELLLDPAISPNQVRVLSLYILQWKGFVIKALKITFIQERFLFVS